MSSVEIGRGWCGRRFLGRLSLLLVSATLFAAPIALGSPHRSDVPVSIQLVSEVNQTGVLHYVAERYQDSGGSNGNPLAVPVETGFELSFVGEIPSAGRVKVTLNLVLKLAEGGLRGKPVGVRELTVAASFEAADGDSVLIPETVNGPSIVATPRIVTVNSGPTMVYLEVRVPIGGNEFALPRQQLVKNISLLGTEESDNRVRETTGHSFLTGVADDKAVLTTLETGALLAARTSTNGGSTIGMDIAVDCEVVDDSVATKRVRDDGFWREIQLPVARSVSVDTMANIRSGDTFVLAGIESGNGENAILIFATPMLVVGSPVPQVHLEARIVLIGGGGNVAEVEGSTERTRYLKQITSRASEPRTGLLLDSAQQTFVVGYRAGEPVTLTLESGTVLEFEPTTLAPGELSLGLRLTRTEFAAETRRFPFVTASGKQWVDLPEMRSLELHTNFAANAGETVALAGYLLNRNLPKSSQRGESVVFATVDVLADGAVRLDGRLTAVAEETGLSKKGPTEVEQSVEEELMCAEIEP
jgi:hypothetical protein